MLCFQLHELYNIVLFSVDRHYLASGGMCREMGDGVYEQHSTGLLQQTDRGPQGRGGGQKSQRLQRGGFCGGRHTGFHYPGSLLLRSRHFRLRRRVLPSQMYACSCKYLESFSSFLSRKLQLNT